MGRSSERLSRTRGQESPAKVEASDSEVFFFSDFMSHLLVSFSLGRVCHWHNFWPIKIEGKEWPGN